MFDDAVEFDRGKSGGDRRVDSLEHSLDIAASRYFAEALRAERVEADVDPPESGLLQLRGEVGKENSVRAHCVVRDAVDLSEHFYEVEDVSSYERFAAGQSDLVYAHPDGRSNDVFNLFEGEDVFVSQPCDACFGHAVDASQVAAVGY